MTEAEQIMKRCQVGTRNYDEANNLHADCYRVIGKLLKTIAELESQEPVAKPTEDMVLALRGNSGLCNEDAYDALVDVLAVIPLYTTPQQRKPLTDEQMFDLAEIAWRHGWASCRDAEYIGEEAEDERWGMIGAEVVQNMAAHGIKE